MSHQVRAILSDISPSRVCVCVCFIVFLCTYTPGVHVYHTHVVICNVYREEGWEKVEAFIILSNGNAEFVENQFEPQHGPNDLTEASFGF